MFLYYVHNPQKMDELELDIDGLYLTMHRTIGITNYRTIGLELVRVQVRGELG